MRIRKRLVKKICASPATYSDDQKKRAYEFIGRKDKRLIKRFYNDLCDRKARIVFLGEG